MPLCDTVFRASGRAAKAGDELYSTYGPSWFHGHGIELADAAQQPDWAPGEAPPAEDVVPGCAGSDIAVRRWQPHATTRFAAGDVVEVSPGLVLSAGAIAGTELESFTLPLFDRFGGGRHSLLLLGKGALYYLARPHDGGGPRRWWSARTGWWHGVPNLEARWWPEQPDSESFGHTSSAKNLGLFVKFTATRAVSGQNLARY